MASSAPFTGSPAHKPIVSTFSETSANPIGQLIARPRLRCIAPTLRQAVALAAAAAANGVPLSDDCRIPRGVAVEGVQGLIENGVVCDIATSALGALVEAADPREGAFDLSKAQAANVVGLIGLRKSVDLEVMPASALAHAMASAAP